MNTIAHLKQELLESNGPVMKVLHNNKCFKVLVLGLNKGMVLKEHTAKWSSKLTVLEGSVDYLMSGHTINLLSTDDHDIPIGEPHSVLALEDSLCLLTQSNPDYE